MTVRSVRQALNAMGLGGVANASVMHHVLGFWRVAPTDPSTGTPVVVSLAQQFQGLSGRHLHVNMIEVGLDTLSASDMADRVDYSVHRIRQIYSTRQLGLGRVQYFWITAAASNGRDDLGSESEADSLSDEWSVNNNGIDMFLVRTISDDFVGISPVPGDCNKGDKSDGMVGGEVNREAEGFSRTAAHELGHFLNLSHNHGESCPTANADRDNLMAQTRCARECTDLGPADLQPGLDDARPLPSAARRLERTRRADHPDANPAPHPLDDGAAPLGPSHPARRREGEPQGAVPTSLSIRSPTGPGSRAPPRGPARARRSRRGARSVCEGPANTRDPADRAP